MSEVVCKAEPTVVKEAAADVRLIDQGPCGSYSDMNCTVCKARVGCGPGAMVYFIVAPEGGPTLFHSGAHSRHLLLPVKPIGAFACPTGASAT